MQISYIVWTVELGRFAERSMRPTQPCNLDADSRSALLNRGTPRDLAKRFRGELHYRAGKSRVIQHPPASRGEQPISDG